MAVLGKEGFVRGMDYRGVEVAAVIRKVEGSNWFLLAKIDTAEAYAKWRFRSALLLALILGSAMLMIVTGMMLWQRASKAYFQRLYRSEATLRASKERHSIILNAIGDAVIATDADGKVELLNPVAELLTGWTQNEAKGKALAEVFHIVNAKTREKTENPVSKVLREGVVVGLANHTVLIARDGTEYQIADSAAPIKDSDNAVSGVVLVFRNVTKEYQMRDALKASERYYRGLIYSLHEDILVIDREYRVTDINNSALQTLGLSRDEAIGRFCYELSHGLDSPCHENTGTCQGCGLLQVFEKGEVCKLHHEHIDQSGKRRHIDLLCTPLRDKNGRITQMVEAARDVSDLLATQDALAESEEKYRALFSNAPLPYMSLDEKGCFLDVNPAWLTTLGYLKEDVLGSPLAAYLHPGFRTPFKAKFKTCKKNGHLNGFELKLKHRNGHYIDASFTGRISYHQDGRFFQAYCVFEDITDRKQAEENLRRLISAINHTSEAIVITDIEGSIQYTNPAIERVTGYTAEEVLGQNPRLFKSGKQDEAFYRHLWQTILGGETWRGRMTNKRKDGSLYAEETVISPVLNDAGDAANFVAVKRDITAEIQMEERLRQSQKMEAIGALAGGIAHDFNNILFPIMGMSELLLQDLPSESPEHANARAIYSAGKRGSELIKQILAFSRQSEGKKIPTHIQQIVKEVIKLSRSTIPSSIEISHQVQADCGLVIADPIQIHQIVMNLITNAYHAVEHNRGSISIQLKETCLESDDLVGRPIVPGRYALLIVSDTGTGIDPTVKDKIFEPYFTTKALGKGTGLGLSTVYGIVNQHNGDITVKSEVGMGAAFKVYLPLMSETDSSVSIDPSESLSFGKERILLVDDDAAIAQIEKKMLERLGYQVTSRVSSLDALEAFKANPYAYELIVSDMTMPNMTGDQLARAVLAIRQDIPVVICTGYSEWIDPEKAEVMGIKGFLMKPVLLPEMAKMVRNVLDS
jgi:PAS domain S-box-containing protein